jgi:hypothetical protein
VAARLIRGRSTLTPTIIPLVGFALHRNILCWALIAWPDFYAELLV